MKKNRYALVVAAVLCSVVVVGPCPDEQKKQKAGKGHLGIPTGAFHSLPNADKTPPKGVIGLRAAGGAAAGLVDRPVPPPQPD